MSQEQQDVRDAIARARVAARRMVLAQSLVDEIGVQLAFQAVLYNLRVIGDAVKAIPPDVLARVPDFPWAEYADVADVIEPDHFRIDPPEIQRTLEAALDPLDDAMSRLAPVR
jgi:uncharacterized protein with HEPN domain